MKDKLFLLIRYALGIVPTAYIDENDIPEIYKLAKKYDLAQIMAYSLEKLGFSDDILFKEKAISIYRTENLKYAAEQICSVLEEARLPHMLLKGRHMRALYPEEWMRPSCDIDVYVDASDIEAAASALEASGFVRGSKSSHDIGFTAPNGCHTELHFDLIEEEWLTNSKKIFANVWQSSIKRSEYRYKMNDDMLYFYHVAHLAKHIKNGGCGIRPFVDLWLLNKSSEPSAERERLLKAGGLLKFESAARRLSEVWLSDGEHTPVTESLEEYVFSGNLYGSLKNNTVIHRRNAGSRLNYIILRLFMPYSQLSRKYPSLQGKPLLFPFYTVRRWFSLLNGKISARVKGEMAVGKDEIELLSVLFSRLGL